MPIELEAGEKRVETVRLWPGASIAGIVLNELNEPMPGVRVQAWRKWSGASASSEHRGFDSPPTDSSGRYRISGLPPDEYIVEVQVGHLTAPENPTSSPGPFDHLPPTAFGSIGLQPARAVQYFPPDLAHPVRPDGVYTYETTFFPNATSRDQAVALTLALAEQRPGIDFQLRAVRPAHVEGRVIRARDEPFGNDASVSLRRPGVLSDEFADASATLNADGTFALRDVPPGPYVLEVRRFFSVCDFCGDDDGVTRVSIQVPSEGIDGLDVPLSEGLTVRGRLVTSGTSAYPRPVSVVLSPIDSPTSMRSILQSTRGSNFVIPRVSPGRYLLRGGANLQMAGWFVESITLDGQDATGPIEIASDSNGLVVTVTDRPSPVAGEVLGEFGKPAVDATVVAFPADRRLWSGQPLASRFAAARVQHAKYRFDHLLPGDYLVVVVDERQMDDWPTPGFLNTLARRAVPLRVESGRAHTLTLR
jgi:hypothetical protein